MKRLLAGFIVVLSANAEATTWYVRTDGGSYGTTSTTCNGQTDAAFTGANGPNCAVNHPFEVLGVYGGSPRVQRIAGGDTVVIKNGSYRMGVSAGTYDTGSCYSAWSYDCVMAPIPSGPNSSTKTKIYGEGYASCTTKPELWGAGGASRILNLDGSSNVDVRCLDLTDHDDCGGNYASYSCPAYSPSVTWASRGIYAYNGSNNELTDVNVHGFAQQGVLIGKQTDFAATRVNVLGNAMAGIDQDTVNADDAWAGSNIFDEVRIEWNGCSENYPVNGTYLGCTDQNNSGYGDGWGSPSGGTGGNFTFTDGTFKFNTSDGLDMLYNSDSSSLVTVDRMYFEGNVGNSIKTGGNKTIVRNTVIVANCGYWDNFSSKGPSFSTCRAGGNALVANVGAGNNFDYVNNTVIGEADILIEVFGCNGSEALNVQNNILIGTTQYGGGDTTSWLYAYDGCVYGTLVNSTNMKNNFIYGVKESTPCSGQTSCSTSDPQVTTANFTTEVFDLRLQSGSPARDAGLNTGTTVGQTTVPTVDVSGATRTAGAVDVGAWEYATSTPTMAACSLPVATVGVAYDWTITVTGGTTPYTACDETSGSLPAGSPAFTSTATANGCQITGTPTGVGTSNFTERVTDSSAQTDSEACTLVVNAVAPTITTTTLSDGVVGVAYSACLATTGGQTPFTWSKLSGTYCGGISINASTGCVEGIPTTAETCNFTARVTDANTNSDDQALTLTIDASVATLVGYANPGSVAASFSMGFAGLPYTDDCNVTVKLASTGAVVSSCTSFSGSATRKVGCTGLAPSTAYTATFACDSPSTAPTINFTTGVASSGNRTVPILIGAPSSVISPARVTVEYDDNEALSSPASVQNTSCGSGCTVNLTIPAGLYWWRHVWQTAGDVTIATSAIQPLVVE